MPFGAMAGANEDTRPGLRSEFVGIGRPCPVRGRAGVRRVPRVVLVVAAEEFCFCRACCDRREGNGQCHKGAMDAFGGHFFSSKFSTPRPKLAIPGVAVNRVARTVHLP